MPELLTKEVVSFSKDLKATGKTILGPPTSEIKEIARKNDVKYIGDGSECAVVLLNNDEEKHVVAFRYNEISPEKAKKTYYVQRILSTLFPHNFPHFHSSFSGNSEQNILPGTVRTKINKSSEKEDAKYNFAKVKMIADDDLDLPLGFDLFEGNFSIGPDGGEYFLDTPIIFPVGNWDKERIMNYMKSKKKLDGSDYSAKDIRLVSNSLDRIAKLDKVKPQS